MIDIHWPSLFLGIVSTSLMWFIWMFRLKRKIQRLINHYNLERLLKMQDAVIKTDSRMRTFFGTKEP